MMFIGVFIRLLGATSVLVDIASAAAVRDPLSGFAGVTFKRVRSGPRVASQRKLKISRFSEPLKRVSKDDGHARIGADLALAAVQRQLGDGYGYTNVTSANKYGTSFAIDVTFGNTTMALIVDSGSSDTWAVSSNFECVDWLGTIYKQEVCGFGRAYPGTFKEILDDQYFSLRYGSGETVSGPLGKLDVTVAGIHVKNQEVALANSTYWHGNNYTSGLVGLAYPSLTSAYYGSSPGYNGQITYNPLLTEMINQGAIDDPVWSIAINRNASDGVIAFGGLPDLPELYSATAASTDIIIAQLISTRPETAYKPSFYTIISDGVVYGQAVDTTKYPYIVDTGTTLLYLPPQLAEAVNAAFDPPAKYLWGYGGYFTSCDAIAPRFAVVVSGRTFWMNPIDMIFRDFKDPITGLCQTAVTTGGSGPYILGSTFLQNTVTVFDIGNQMMTFFSRPFY